MQYNHENIRLVEDSLEFINHIHISEPYLKPITFNQKQCSVIQMIKERTDYQGYVSIEMSRTDHLEIVKNSLIRLKSI